MEILERDVGCKSGLKNKMFEIHYDPVLLALLTVSLHISYEVSQNIKQA